MAILGFLPAPFWIAALAIIWLTSQAALKRVPAQARVPVPFGLDFAGRWRLPRNLAFGVAVGVPLVVGIALMAAARTTAGDPSQLAILVGLRVAAATLFAVAHLAWLVASMKRLHAEGALRP